MLLHLLYANALRSGDLSVAHEDRSVERLGDGTGAPVAIRLSRRGLRLIATRRSLGLGQAYMDGELSFQTGDLWDLLTLIDRNRPERHDSGMASARHALLRRLRQINDRRRARRNVAHHYDFSTDVYRRFLDADLQYSCAYFREPGMRLEAAQAAKKAHIAAKLRLSPGRRVLDIGCGWGGMALTLARDYGARVIGVTLSEPQLQVARARAAAAGLTDRVRFELKDYRDVEPSYDRIVSVGMLEHVGAPNYGAFFDKVRSLLTADGVALIHCIGRMEPPGITDDFIRTYIFPGGYIPALSEVVSSIEHSGLWITDVEILRRHYAETLRCWRERFMADRAEIAAVYDDRFCRMFEYYLAISELSFRTGAHMVMQVQLSRQADALPLTRDYMVDVERTAARRSERASEPIGMR